MNIFKGIGILFFLFLLSSCVKDEKTNSFKMELDLVMKTNDSIHVFYSNNASVEFNEKQSYWIKVKGSKKNQTINFTFPDTIQPKQIRIDFGRNKKQPEIILNEIAFYYKKEKITAKGEEVYFLFRVDESNTVIDKLVGSLKRKEPNQATGPSLYPKGDKLYNKLSQLYTEK